MKLGTRVGLGTGHIVLDVDPAPLPQRGTAHNFGPISVVLKWLEAGWIKMQLGMEVGLGPGDFALDGNPAPTPQKRGGTPPPQF